MHGVITAMGKYVHNVTSSLDNENGPLDAEFRADSESVKH